MGQSERCRQAYCFDEVRGGATTCVPGGSLQLLIVPDNL